MHSGNWTFATKPLKHGAHSFTARAAIGGEVSGLSPIFKAIVDHAAPAAPTVALDRASDTGLSSADRITSDTTPTLTGNAEAGARVIVRDGATVLGIATANAAGKWTLTTGPLADGVHRITATAIDRAGNVSHVSLTRTITVDTTAPAAPASPDLAAASDSGAAAGDNLTNDTTPTLTGTAEEGSTVTIRDGATVLGATVADGSGHWSLTTGVLSEGVHSITVMATDKAGNAGAQSTPLAVTIDTSPPAPPSAPDLAAGSDTGSSDIDNLTGDATPTFTGTAGPGATITLKDGTTVLVTTTADVNGDWSVTSPALGDGSHAITATTMDAAGNESASAALSVTVDTSPPAPPSVPDLAAGSDSGSSGIDNLTDDATPTFTGTAEPGRR